MFKNEKLVKTIILTSIIVILGIIFIVNICEQQDNDIQVIQDEPIIDIEDNNIEQTETEIYVFICGAVVNSGVYQVNTDTRVFEIIEKAGGLTEEASKDFINQASRVVDGQKIYIPTQKEVENGYTENNEISSSKLININTASVEELKNIPNIGEAKAQSIIKYRKEKGGFKSIEDIKNIEGIKDGIFNKIKDFITVN